MFLYNPFIGPSQITKQRVYSSFLQNLISHHATIFVNSMVLSEFANTCLRNDFDKYKKQENKDLSYKKDYVGTSRYRSAACAVSAAIKQIEGITEKISDNFNAIDMNTVLNNLLEIDFNDAYIAELCKINSFKLLTDDKDFSKITTPIQIISDERP